MGLSAVVYTNKSNLALEQNRDDIKIVKETGEVYLENTEISQEYPQAQFVAIDIRLGNISEIAALRGEVSKILDNNSILSSRVLYNGSHCGDVTGIDCFGELEAELSQIRRETTDNPPQGLDRFLDAISALIEVAQSQQNPIVFV